MPPEPIGLEQQRTTTWGQERRLQFIDYRLRWEGRINRTDLTSHFGISVPQASLDLAKYAELAPQNLVYDRRSKAYFPTERFRSAYPSSSASRYLADLLAIKAGITPADTSFAGSPPVVDWAPVSERTINDSTVEALVKAIRRRLAVRVRYQSMSSPDLSERLLSPHAFGNDGFRWHVRAYCHKRRAFVDFVIARILEIQGFEHSSVDPLTDTHWHTTLTLVLAPCPSLPPGKRRVIELDYGMHEGQVALPCRQAFLFYTLRRLGLEAEHRAPLRQQIVLKNRREIQPYIDALTLRTEDHEDNP